MRSAAVGQHCVDCLRNDGIIQRATVPTFGDRGIRPVVAQPITARRPIATYTLIAINLAVFVWCMISAKSFDVGLSAPLEHGELVRGNVFLGEYWRLFTAGFLHYSIPHIALNMISLYILGRDLEIALGLGRFVMVYVTALFGGSAAALLTQANAAHSAGASGAIYGLMGAMLIVVLRLKVSPTPVIVIIVINLVMSLSIPGISLAAHVGGLIFGAAATAAIIYAPRFLPAAHQTQRNAALLGWGALVALLVLAIGISVGYALTYNGPILYYVR